MMGLIKYSQLFNNAFITYFITCLIHIKGQQINADRCPKTSFKLLKNLIKINTYVLLLQELIFSLSYHIFT